MIPELVLSCIKEPACLVVPKKPISFGGCRWRRLSSDDDLDLKNVAALDGGVETTGVPNLILRMDAYPGENGRVRYAVEW